MSHILEDLSPEAVIDAMADNMCAYLRSLSEGAISPHLTFHDDGDIQWYISDVPFPLLNVVMCAKLEAGSEDRRIDEVLGEYKAAGMPMLWWTGPASRPSDIGSRLMARGLVNAGAPPGMAVDLTRLDASEEPPPGVTIQRVDRDAALDDYGHILQQAFELPDLVVGIFVDVLKTRGYDEAGPAQNYLAYLEGTPVAACTVGYEAGVAGIYNVGTLERARGRGIGRAITLRSLLDARERGYKVGVLEASGMGHNVYRQLGFEDYCQMELYLHMPGDGQQPALAEVAG
ncbi:MAG TPA: GNAT family N-acetyltransferase [Chloroflexia bacterium]|nr:GNAT family N-acetyltransferase [Chloroflexia bacterium]